MMPVNRDNRITREHLSREAIVYIRQSSTVQVQNNVESTRAQLNLREKAIAFGWDTPNVIDDDLGISASGYADRPGFQELITRVTMKKVGIILCMDASRLSRNSKDWAQLFEMCSYFNTLIADLEQIYDLSRSNDKLVIGIKGTVSEMELSILKTRLRSGIEAKASRGELKTLLPVGYVHDLSGKIVFDPDKRVRRALSLMFDKFDQVTSVRQLAMWYNDTKTLFPIKKYSGGAAIHWGIPNVRTLYHIFTHPIYAGAYVWGRRGTRIEYAEGKLVKRVYTKQEIDQYRVFIQDHHPAYISWKRFMENCTKITENRPRWSMEQNKGAIKEGFALLTGLLRCGHCGAKIYVRYKANRKEADGAMYYCTGHDESRSQSCISFGSKRIDHQVGEELCRAVAPLSIDASLQAVKQKEKQRRQVIENARKQVEAAEYESDRAFEQYNQCDPKNRLVAGTLEERLNERLGELHRARMNLEKVENDTPEVTRKQRHRLKVLSRQFPEVWNHPDADLKLKKRLLRAAIFEILVKCDPENHRIEAIIHWQGGVHSKIYVKKRARPRGNKADPSIVDNINKMASELRDDEIARILNMKKIETPRGLRWTKDRVEAFRRHHRIRAGKRSKNGDCLTMKEAAAYLDISRNGLLGLVKMGAVSKNQITEFAPWKVSRAELDTEYVQGLVRTLKEVGRLPKGGCSENQRRLFDVK